MRQTKLFKVVSTIGLIMNNASYKHMYTNRTKYVHSARSLAKSFLLTKNTSLFFFKYNVYFTGDGTYVSPHSFNLSLTLCIDCCLECKKKKKEEKMWFLDLNYKQGSKRFSGIKTY